MTTIRHATSADLPRAADLAVLHSGGERPRWQARFADELDRPGSCLLIADSGGQVAGYGRVRRFKPSPRLGFREVTRDFTYPGVTFTGAIGVLCRAALVSEDSEA